MNGDKSNATIVNYLIKKREYPERMQRKKNSEHYKFVAYEYYSIEYKLIENVDGLYNSKGRKYNA